MRYLLDVSALLALGFIEHGFHLSVARWVSDEHPVLATCSITELGFVRVLAQAPQYAVSLADARTLLLQLKAGDRFEFSFISDNLDIANIPAWAKPPIS